MGSVIENQSPVDPQIKKSFPQPSDTDVQNAFDKARGVLPSWSQTSLQDRIRILGRVRSLIVEKMDEIAEEIQLWTGKTKIEAILNELIPVLEVLKFNDAHAKQALRPRCAKTSLSFPKSRSLVEYHPMGVVLVVSPWNFPFQLSLVPICTALLAGNVVLLKVSEATLAIGELIQKLLAEAGLPEHVFTALPGDGQTGQKMVEAKPDLIFVTGSPATGQKIMEQAAKNLTPVLLELGGKDPMIVLEDAPFERAVNAAVYGAFANAGQICVSVERLYVHENIIDKFTEALLKKTSEIRVGLSDDSDVGMMTTRHQVDNIKTQLKDAQKKGAVLLTEPRIDGHWVHPIILKNVNHDMVVMKDETFGPVLPIMSFSSEEEALKLVNDSPFGLNASIWTKDLKKGRCMASHFQTGNCVVNDVVKNIGNPHLPFGGIKRSGFGRYHGVEGLRAFSRSMSIMINKGTAKRELNWFPYSSKLYKDLKIYLQFSYLKKNSLGALRNIWGTMKAYRKGQDD